ncbi:hypothetical protein [Bradyrhizobium yuanmingense]|nr:hypothetical protein [Bradyrhizobium yuanmingense]
MLTMLVGHHMPRRQMANSSLSVTSWAIMAALSTSPPREAKTG